ncbi:MAG: hypothetical protein H0Z39_07630 [Peptococcaceae bacterium]|nr:hypothetical protein [Peptococcaceae bacterium]
MAFKSKLANSLLNFLLFELISSHTGKRHQNGGDDQDRKSSGRELLLSMLQQYLLNELSAGQGVQTICLETSPEKSVKDESGLSRELLPLLLQQLMSRPGTEADPGDAGEDETGASDSGLGKELLPLLLQQLMASQETESSPDNTAAESEAKQDTSPEQLIEMLKDALSSQDESAEETGTDNEPYGMTGTHFLAEEKWNQFFLYQQQIIDKLQAIDEKLQQLDGKAGELTDTVKEIAEKRQVQYSPAATAWQAKKKSGVTGQDATNETTASASKGESKEAQEPQINSSGKGKIIYWHFPESQTN